MIVQPGNFGDLMNPLKVIGDIGGSHKPAGFAFSAHVENDNPALVPLRVFRSAYRLGGDELHFG